MLVVVEGQGPRVDNESRSSTGSRRYVPEGLPEGRVVRLDGEAAREFADLVSLKHDFVMARESLEELLGMLDSHRAASGDEDSASDSGTIVERALFSAAVTSYGRAFKSGVRRAKLDERAAIAGDRSEANLLQTHQYLLDLRDKHLAHSVSPLEEVHVSAVLVESGGREVRSITHTRLAFAFPDPGKLQLMLRLCRLMEDHVEVREFKSANRLFFQATGAVDALYELPLMEIFTPVETEVAGESRAARTRRRSP